MGKFTDAPMAKLTFELLESDDPDDPESRLVGDVGVEASGDTAVIVFWRGEWAEAARGEH